jgi:hypothetical protein
VKRALVTLVTLIYRDLRWLDFVMEGVARAKTDVAYRWLVVANDATPEVAADPRIDIDFRNDDPAEFYINRVYRAWNAGVEAAPTQLVVMLNSDMYVSDGWLDELLDVRQRNPLDIPTSLLIESGRIPSAMPEYVQNCGLTPETFLATDFRLHASNLRANLRGTIEAGRLFMPILVDRQEFHDVCGYPEGNPPGTTGDKDLIRRYTEAGFRHVTAMGSVVYHVQCGEQLETAK